jgi:two-component system response regulator HydG
MVLFEELDLNIRYMNFNKKYDAPSDKPNVLAVGAHPDDIEIGAAMILHALREEYNVYSIICTDGSESRRGTPEDRLTESINAAQMMGIDGLFYLGMKDTQLPFATDLIQRIEKVISYTSGPDIVFNHNPHDRHQDHEAVQKAVRVAARHSPEIYLFHGPSTEPEFTPHKFFSFKLEDLEFKIKVLEQFKTQIESGIIDLDLIRSTARFFGGLAKSHQKENRLYAEAFEINHSIVTY